MVDGYCVVVIVIVVVGVGVRGRVQFRVSGLNSGHAITSVPLLDQILKPYVVQQALQRSRSSVGRSLRRVERLPPILLAVRLVPQPVRVQVPGVDLGRGYIGQRIGGLHPPQRVRLVKVLLVHEVHLVVAQQLARGLPELGGDPPRLVDVVHLDLSGRGRWLPRDRIHYTAYVVPLVVHGRCVVPLIVQLGQPRRVADRRFLSRLGHRVHGARARLKIGIVIGGGA